MLLFCRHGITAISRMLKKTKALFVQVALVSAASPFICQNSKRTLHEVSGRLSELHSRKILSDLYLCQSQAGTERAHFETAC